jgi:hypothetical protein
MKREKKPMLALSTELQQILLHKRVLCFFATTLPDGSPHVTQTWVDISNVFTIEFADIPPSPM